MRLNFAFILALSAACMGACIASAPEGIQRYSEQSGGSDAGFSIAASTASSSVGSGENNGDPYAVIGVSPPHGPFSGGQLVTVYGRGFVPGVRLWFGDQEATNVVAIDPTRAQANAPAQAPGTVDVSAQNGNDASTRRTLPQAYSYDPLYAEPDSGPVAGGTVIRIVSSNQDWLAATSIEARIDNKPCSSLSVVSANELACTVPQGTPGSKGIRVTTNSADLNALDAFTYQDSDDGFKGGLGGKPLAGTLKVLAFNNFTGDPLVGAHVIVGSSLATGLYQQADSAGMALFNDPSLDQPATVTVTAKCHSPITFVDVPVDSVTVYLDPTLTPQCGGDGDPPPVGGKAVQTGQINGQLVWPAQQEFQKGAWTNIPAPNANEARIAYVFFGNRDPQRTFQLPSKSYAVYEDSPGNIGYGFQITSYPGTQALYALAGLENKLTGAFSAYAFGRIEGVSVSPGKATETVIISMATPLDQALTVAPAPPPVGPKGPDRINGTVAVEIATNRFAILPNMRKTPLLPLAAPLAFVGLPPLDGPLTGSRYIAAAEAVTGSGLSAPMSVVGRVTSNNTSQPLVVDGFVSVPVLKSPANGSPWNGRDLSVEFVAGGFPAQLSVYDISSAGGLVRWQVAVPTASHSIQLPDLGGFEDAHLPPGPLSISVYGARYDDFEYGTLSYRQLRPRGMNAYSLDIFPSFL